MTWPVERLKPETQEMRDRRRKGQLCRLHPKAWTKVELLTSVTNRKGDIFSKGEVVKVTYRTSHGLSLKPLDWVSASAYVQSKKRRRSMRNVPTCRAWPVDDPVEQLEAALLDFLAMHPWSVARDITAGLGQPFAAYRTILKVHLEDAAMGGIKRRKSPFGVGYEYARTGADARLNAWQRLIGGSPVERESRRPVGDAPSTHG